MHNIDHLDQAGNAMYIFKTSTQNLEDGSLIYKISRVNRAIDHRRYYSYFMITPSRMPSDLKLGEKSLGSTDPGRLNEIEKGPGGHCC